MPHLSTSLLATLLIAMLTSGCASQNAMSLLPESVKLDVARDKAVKQGPLSVDEMMTKARKLHPNAVAETQIADKVDDTKTATLPERLQQVGEPAQSAYAEEKIAASQDQANSPSALFQQAIVLSEQTRTGDQSPSFDEIKAAAAADEWRKLMDEQGVEKSAADSSEPIVANVEPPLVMPLTEVEIIPVNFNKTRDSLTKDDDLKIRLLRFGKRIPQQITIGKITNAQGFQVMQSALALGKIVTQASGGSPEITYDPALAAGVAQVRYASTRRQS